MIPFLHDKYTFLLQEAKHSERTRLHHKGPKHHHHKLITFQDSNCYCGRRWNHKMKKSFFCNFIILQNIAKSLSKNELCNLKKAFSNHFEVEQTLHKLACRAYLCDCAHVQIINIAQLQGSNYVYLQILERAPLK